VPIAYDPFLATLSVVVAVLASYSALELSRTSLCAPHRTQWAIGAAVMMGLGVWAMHFTAMGAMELRAAPSYNLLLTALSAAPAMVCTGLAFVFVLYRGVRLRNLVMAGALMAAGIVTMHYTGMAAYAVQGFLIVHDWKFVATAGVLAFLASTTALWLSFRTSNGYWQVPAAVALGLAIAGMHYTGVYGMAFCTSPGATYDFGPFTLTDADGKRIGIFSVLIGSVASTCGAVIASSQRSLLDLRADTANALQQTQKMEAMGQLTGGVAHDFNNLLQVMSGGVDMLARAKDPQKAELIRAEIKRAVARGQSLTKQLLAFARRQRLEAKVVDLAAHLQETRQLLEQPLDNKAVFELDIASDVWPINIDPSALDNALLNLVVNARDAMPDGGKVRLSVRNHHAPVGSSVNLRTGLAGDLVEIAVEDTGVGMSPAVQAKAFEPFFTTKDAGAGSGLGLAQVWGFVQQSGGAVVIDSRPGEGTAVRMFLTKSSEQAAQPAPHLVSTATSPRGSILMVEDDASVAAMVTRMLEELGLTVSYAAGVDAAMEALQTNPADYVLTDIVLPGRSGLELASFIRETFPALPVVLMTGFTKDLEKKRELGFPVLRKPFTIEELAAALGARPEVAARKAV
jgi:NO-binding membrane sensor protein with MHYT domain/CheY-like chemotaxis protein